MLFCVSKSPLLLIELETAVDIVTQYMMMSDVHVRIIANTTTEVLKVFRYSIWNCSCAVCVCVCVCVVRKSVCVVRKSVCLQSVHISCQFMREKRLEELYKRRLV